MTNENLNGTTVVAHFSDGDSAHRAILELRDMGFDASTIGAAFHSHYADESAGEVSEHFNTIGKVGSHFEAGGATSDTSAVTPSGLSTGAGSPSAGATRPGPIPGGEIPSTLPHSIPSSLHPAQPVASSVRPVSTIPVATGVRTDWSDRLNPIFSSHETSSSRKPEDPVKEAKKDEKAAASAAKSEAKSKQEFGTGQGRLGLVPTYHPYSGAAFETSFSQMGVAPVHARRVSQELSHGGAVVTVNAGARVTEAEQIIARNNGSVRYEEPASLSGTGYNASPARMQLFGEMRRTYPLDAEGDAPAVRKAS